MQDFNKTNSNKLRRSLVPTENHELLYSNFSQKLKPSSNQVTRDHIPRTPSPVRALRYAASVDTNVFVSPVFISAIDPS
jgi:hypothetical protein